MQEIYLADETFAPEHSDVYTRIITANREAFTCLVADNVRKKLIFLHSVAAEGESPQDYLSSLEKFVEKSGLNSSVLKQDICFLGSERLTLLPAPVWKEDKSKDLIGFLYGKDENPDSVISAKIHHSDIMMISEVHESLATYAKKSFTRTYPLEILLIKKVLKARGPLCISLNLSDNRVDICITEKDSLHFFNHFRCTTPDDLVYYVLAACSEFSPKPGEIPVIVYGFAGKGDERISKLKDHFRDVKMAKSGTSWLLSYRFNEIPQQYFSLLFDMWNEDY
jgi:hypothetical protein